jgi:hypothetical protein
MWLGSARPAAGHVPLTLRAGEVRACSSNRERGRRVARVGCQEADSQVLAANRIENIEPLGRGFALRWLVHVAEKQRLMPAARPSSGYERPIKRLGRPGCLSFGPFWPGC